MGCFYLTSIVEYTANGSSDQSADVRILYYCAADNGGGDEKKAKVEVSEEELRAHVQNGTLGKLTVPMLKEACKKLGFRTTGTKKQDLIDALIAQMGP